MIELATARASSAAAPQEFFERWVDHATWSEWSLIALVERSREHA